MADSRTTMCVYCLKKKATSWGGYVKDGRKKVMAGWCGRHASQLDKAFAGHLLPQMVRQFDAKGKWRK
jgi:hypothetical protein